MIAILSATTSSVLRQRPSSSVAPSQTLQSQELIDTYLSAWEKWILQKAKEERDAAELKLQQQEETEKMAELERAKREKIKAEIQTKIEQYHATVKQQQRLQQKHEKAEQELKDEQKSEMLNKAKDKFQVCSITLSVWLIYCMNKTRSL